MANFNYPDVSRLRRRFSRLEQAAGDALQELEASQLAMRMALEDLFECTNGAFDATRKTAEALAALRRILLEIPELRDAVQSLPVAHPRQQLELRESISENDEYDADSKLRGPV